MVFQTGCFGFCGRQVDQIDYYRARISELDKRVRLQFVGVMIRGKHFTVHAEFLDPMQIRCTYVYDFNTGYVYVNIFRLHQSVKEF